MKKDNDHISVPEKQKVSKSKNMNDQKLKFVASVTSLSGVYIWYYNY